jgi:hypothetical protein
VFLLIPLALLVVSLLIEPLLRGINIVRADGGD